jgi:hypothetical protein
VIPERRHISTYSNAELREASVALLKWFESQELGFSVSMHIMMQLLVTEAVSKAKQGKKTREWMVDEMCKDLKDRFGAVWAWYDAHE